MITKGLFDSGELLDIDSDSGDSVDYNTEELDKFQASFLGGLVEQDKDELETQLQTMKSEAYTGTPLKSKDWVRHK